MTVPRGNPRGESSQSLGDEARTNRHLYVLPLKFNNNYHQRVLVNIVVLTPHLHQVCIFQCLSLNQALMDRGLVTHWGHQGQMCTPCILTGMQYVPARTGEVYCTSGIRINVPTSLREFRSWKGLVSKLVASSAKPAQAFPGPGGHGMFYLCWERRSWGRHQRFLECLLFLSLLLFKGFKARSACIWFGGGWQGTLWSYRVGRLPWRCLSLPGSRVSALLQKPVCKKKTKETGSILAELQARVYLLSASSTTQ